MGHFVYSYMCICVHFENVVTCFLRVSHGKHLTGLAAGREGGSGKFLTSPFIVFNADIRNFRYVYGAIEWASKMVSKHVKCYIFLMVLRTYNRVPAE